jgi:hypothetical protein
MSKNAFPQFSKFRALSKLGKYPFAEEKPSLQNMESPCVNQKCYLCGNQKMFPLKLVLSDPALKLWWRTFEEAKTGHIPQAYSLPGSPLQHSQPHSITVIIRAILK